MLLEPVVFRHMPSSCLASLHLRDIRGVRQETRSSRLTNDRYETNQTLPMIAQLVREAPRRVGWRAWIGQREADAGAVVSAVVEPDPAAVPGHDPSAQRESDPGPGVRLDVAKAVEQPERLFALARRNTDPVVGDGHLP